MYFHSIKQYNFNTVIDEENKFKGVFSELLYITESLYEN